ncbi:MAG: NusA antitermination factor [Candidatus Magasanikbacteria bacterium GW2011_GWA2_56_11]|uniref:Transcription termination/antitermination protein NusA n=1 Tax=Candidatus Magasanikbacteria bacterium GW2011_GWA2_56_11 TaxID=1619044 RepID=A0A0G1YE76_9BACT|nr:MAG: NusA antitermination factor [Candidatus Magasanikbacteria bacterium GW2011_GWA2_56_11]
MSEITKAIQILCDDKGLDYNIVMEALESALAAAYRKDFGNRQQNIKVKFDPETGDMEVWDEKVVVEDVDPEELERSQTELTERREQARKEQRELSEEEIADLVRFNPKTDIMIGEAKAIKPNAELGETLVIPLEVPGDFGRMAAQTAKQVIIQKLREAERTAVVEDFRKQQGSIVFGFVQRFDRSGSLIVDLGKVTGIVPPAEQVRRDHYKLGTRLKFYVVSVDMGLRGPEIILSRADKRMVQVIFEQEIPEIANGDVVIRGIAREAGNRSKVAVATDDEGIDPIGSCIGQRGSRITTIIDELGGEKVDIIQYSDDPAQYIKQALSPAKVAEVSLNPQTKEAAARVAPDQFSLAIGRDGQNVRLAAELSGWKIKVEEIGGEAKIATSDGDGVPAEEPAPETPETEGKENAGTKEE